MKGAGQKLIGKYLLWEEMVASRIEDAASKVTAKHCQS
jgi:hypothetical protein